MTSLKNIHTNINSSFNTITNNGNIFGSSDLNIKFKSGIRSVNLPQYNFANFVNKYDKKYIKFIKKEFKRILYGNLNVLEEYNDKPVGVNKKNKDRLNDVFYETYFYNYQLPFLKRLTKKNNERFQLYYCCIDNNNVEIIFIDLFHLLIPATDKEHKQVKAEPKKTYNQVKFYEVDIKDLF